MTDVAGLGGGYADSKPDAAPTVSAVLDAACPGAKGARLVVIAGPPGVGKSLLARGLCEHLPHSTCVDKDWTAGGFILAAARQADAPPDQAYGRQDYWQCLRPLEYAGATKAACANLIGRRVVLLVGGWGPELSVDELWSGLSQQIAPAQLIVLHLNAPPTEIWRQRMAGRGSRSEDPWFGQFALAVTSHPVWPGAHLLASAGSSHTVLQNALHILSE
ncbi:MAG: hypothetical protein HN712_09035 [Gemmatimonadetes bacterium]|nr:hypothetical protein [Gemmatimonadota bacterium]MBT7860446.1 hypothetical protein [Gemmatimonadota bacterium]